MRSYRKVITDVEKEYQSSECEEKEKFFVSTISLLAVSFIDVALGIAVDNSRLEICQNPPFKSEP